MMLMLAMKVENGGFKIKVYVFLLRGLMKSFSKAVVGYQIQIYQNANFKILSS